MENKSNVMGLRNGIITRTNNDNNNFLINFTYDRKYNSNLLYNNNFYYNPFTDTLTVGNIVANISTSNIDITDTSDNSNFYLTFTDSAGTNKTLRTYTSGIYYNPSLNKLFLQDIFCSGFGQFNSCIATLFTGSGNNLTNLPTNQLSGLVQNNQLQNDNLTIGSTNIQLGNTTTTLTGLSSINSSEIIIGTLTLIGGSITDSGGSISFGNENLTTSGTIDSGNITITGSSIPRLTIRNTTPASLDDEKWVYNVNGNGSLLIGPHNEAGGSVSAITLDRTSFTTNLHTYKSDQYSWENSSAVGTEWMNLTTAGLLVKNDITLTTGSITSASGTISFGSNNLTTSGTLGAGVATLASNSTIGNLTLANGSITDSGGIISFGSNNLTTSGTLGTGVATLASNSTIGNLTLVNGSITDSGGSISFGSNNLTTSGTLGAGVATLASNSTIGNLTLANGSITDSGGSISFGSNNLTTSGTLGAGVATLASNSTIGNLTLANGSITDSGGNITFGSNNLTTVGDANIGYIVISSGDNITSLSGIIDFQSTSLSTVGFIECGSCLITGNVGIGTNNPLDKLSVSGSFTYTRVEGGNNCFGYYGGGNSNSGTGATKPWFASLIGSNGDAETIATSTNGWLWYNRSDNGNLELARRNGSTTDTEVMTFARSSGNVGIGTNNPLDKLSLSGSFTYTRVEGGNNCFGYYGGGNSNSGTGATNPWFASLIGSNGDAETIATSTFGWLWYNRSDNGNLELARRNGSTTDTEVMTFARSSGNVGIGITTPSYKLDLYQTANTLAEWIRSTHATFSSNSLIIDVTRVNATAYNFASFRSSGGGDYEFYFRGDGNAYADNSWNAGGADYAEYFETITGEKIEYGKCVVIEYIENTDRTMVREYNKSTDKLTDILGIVRPKKDCKSAGLIGNNHDSKWKYKYLTNDFGEYLYEDYNVYEWIDENEKEHSYNVGEVPEDIIMPDDVEIITLKRRMKNPEYNEELKYISYENRDEKVLVALLGQIQKLKTEPMKKEWKKCYSISENVEMVYIK